jgi:hypothetical protein
MLYLLQYLSVEAVAHHVGHFWDTKKSLKGFIKPGLLFKEQPFVGTRE